MQESQKVKVLHLAGSTKNEFYYDLGITYARQCDGCPDLDRNSYDFSFAIVGLDKMWSFPTEATKEKIFEAKKFSEHEALAKVKEMGIDVMIPHMFCIEGVTYYRSLFDKMNIPFIGNKEQTISLTIDKSLTKIELIKFGVQVPNGEILKKGVNETPKRKVIPCIVKPCSEDNSFGLSLVKKEEDMEEAIKYAFKYSEKILVEEYIKGREIRVAVIEDRDGSLMVLPKLEYFVKEIRTTENKYAIKNGKLTENPQSDVKKEGDRQCPAVLSEVLERRIDENAMKAHRALNSTHFSLWDMRVDENEQPYILEACPLCSFSPWSVVTGIANKSDREDLHHPGLLHLFLDKVASNKN